MLLQKNFATREDYALYVSKVSWSLFATLTTRYPIGIKRARSLMEELSKRVCRSEEKVFWCAEPFSLGVRAGSYHLHALIQTRWSPKQVEDWWRENFGIAEVRHYNSKKGAVGYVSKYMTKGHHDYDLLFGSKKV